MSAQNLAPDLQRIERRLHHADRLRRKAEEELDEYRRLVELDEVQRMGRAERKQWMVRRTRDLESRAQQSA